jgi:hypothetical protein
MPLELSIRLAVGGQLPDVESTSSLTTGVDKIATRVRSVALERCVGVR